MIRRLGRIHAGRRQTCNAAPNGVAHHRLRPLDGSNNPTCILDGILQIQGLHVVHRLKINQVIHVLKNILNFVNVLDCRVNRPPQPRKKDDIDCGSRNQGAIAKFSFYDSFTFGTRFSFAKATDRTPQGRTSIELHLLQLPIIELHLLQLAMRTRDYDAILLKIFNIDTILIRLIFNKVDLANLALQNFLAATEARTERNLQRRVF